MKYSHVNYTHVLTLALGLAAVASAIPPVPRAAKDFSCQDSTGKPISLSAYRGKVVVLQFLDTGCTHCQALSRLLTKLQAEYGPKGFQAVGVAFNEATADMVRDYVKNNNLAIPVGYAPRDAVLGYLGISVMERIAVPQVMVVDRHSQVRAQSAPQGTPQLQDESSLRGLIESLLR